MLLVLVSTILLVIKVAFASIYATFPVQSSILNAGRLNTVRWKDDNKSPSIKAMGPIKIDLYLDELYLGTLAENVDPTQCSKDVWISPSWGHNGSEYHLRFISERPRMTIFTADFTILGMASLPPFDGPTIDAHNQSAMSITYITPKVTLVLPDATVVSTLQPTTPMEPTATAPPLSGLEDPLHLQGHNGAATAGLRKRPTVDLERLKFRFVFIFWPTLIGITMAL